MALLPGKSRNDASRKVEPILREDKSSVQALSRALTVLEILSEDDDGYRLVDLAERSGLPAPTIHRLLTTLQQRRFVVFESEKNLWRIGPQCFAVGSAFMQRRDMVAIATPMLRRLRDIVGETVNVGGLDQDEILLLHQIESKQTMRAICRPGQRSPLANTAMGKSILAWLPPERVTQLVQQGLPRLTPQSINRGTALHSALREIRQTGYAVDNEEVAIGLRCIAAPVFNEFSLPIAAISVVGPTLRVTLERLDGLSKSVMVAAAEVTAAIGGRLPAEVKAIISARMSTVTCG
ncbi:IclR family transcriptional regulator [Pandoraea horticolens]|uniref:IclR family transcriptional regulator n=1 Tax=Pandoraea horticolens TaxID=2508298 RepID=A0A5E4XP17_9BURK|nr:IclR family transcriptional regulator [Pandoraea horticolens]VVE38179.1 IclR family transcriptional regulator [Pandoraea horticolens]